MLYGHLNTSQLASFIYRWFILRFDSPSKKQIFFLMSILTMPNVVLFITCSVGVRLSRVVNRFHLASFHLSCGFCACGRRAEANVRAGALKCLSRLQIPLVLNNISEDYREMVLRLHPEEADASMATFGVPLAFVDLRGQLPSFWLLFSVVPITFAVFVIRWRILSFLKGQTLFSEQSKTMQQVLLRALTFQAFLPSLYLFGSLISISDNIKEFPLHFEKEFYEYSLFFFCGFVPIIAPICSLYFVSPYRRFVGSLFAKQKPEISPIAVSTSQ